MNTDQKPLAGSEEIDPTEQARADVYRLLAALLAGPPDQALLDAVRNLQPQTTAGTTMNSAWQQLCVAAERAEPEALHQEYFNLFIGLGRGELVPYASWYMHGLLMEKTLASLREVLTTLGFERREGVAEPEDHVAALCEVMGMIISESELSLKQAEFFATYLDPWMGRFFIDLQDAETAVFYKSVGQLGRQFLDIERQFFSLPVE